jgi:hypothetical protein
MFQDWGVLLKVLLQWVKGYGDFMQLIHVLLSEEFRTIATASAGNRK